MKSIQLKTPKNLTLDTAFCRKVPVALVVTRYVSGNQLALQAYDKNSLEPMMTISVNLPDWPRKNPDHFFVKDWSENEGIAEWLEENGIAKNLGYSCPTGFVMADAFAFEPEYLQQILDAGV